MDLIPSRWRQSGGTRRVTFLLAFLVVAADQIVQTTAYRQVALLDELWVTPWLALSWQSGNPAQPLIGATYAIWVGVSVAVLVGIAAIIRRQGVSFSALQILAFGCLLGGTAGHLVDLLRWGHLVATLHIAVPVWGVDTHTGLAKLAQWLGLIGLGVNLLTRRRPR